MKALRLIALLVLLLAMIAGGALWLATRPAPTGPDVARAPTPDEGANPGDAAGDPDALLRGLQRDGRVTVSAADLTELTRTTMASTADGREFLRVSKDLEATINEDFVEVGGTFDLDALDAAQLSPDARTVVEQMRSTVPFLLSGERYIGVRGMPRAVAGNLGFGSDASIRIGTLGLPVGLLTWLGSEEEIANASLMLPDLYVTEVTVDGELLTVEARSEAR